jgi:hypothetical protein
MKKQLINIELHIQISRGHHGLDRMVVGFTTAYAFRTYHH